MSWWRTSVVWVLCAMILGWSTLSPGRAEPALAQPPASALRIGAGGCEPRPPVRVDVELRGEGRVEVTVRPGSGPLKLLRFGPASNARLDFPAGPNSSRGNVTVPLPPGTNATQFIVQREAAGIAVTVPLIVEDGCGEWQTMVGAGPQTWRAALSGVVRSGQTRLGERWSPSGPATPPTAATWRSPPVVAPRSRSISGRWRLAA
jgi:hypothetical protein